MNPASPSPEDEPAIAITGIGLVSAAGRGVEALWQALCRRESHLVELSQIDTEGLVMARGGEVPPGDLPGEDGDDRALRMALHSTDEALRHARMSPEGAARTGLALGTALGSIETLEKLVEDGAADSGASWARVPPEQLSIEVARRLGLGGPRWTFSVTCVSGLYALEQAVADLRLGRAEAMVVGGLDTLSRSMQSGFCSLRALSPSGALRPFDPEHDGIVLGEGAACVVVELLDRARERGAPVLGILRGRSLRSDATHLTSPDATGQGMAEAILEAMEGSGLGEDDLACITPTATGSPIYDLMQSRAVRRALPRRGASIPVTTWEPVTGHALASTGILGLVHAALLLGHREIQPAFGLEGLAEGCELDYVLERPRPLKGRGVLALTVGFGGQNGVSLLAVPGENAS